MKNQVTVLIAISFFVLIAFTSTQLPDSTLASKTSPSSIFSPDRVMMFCNWLSKKTGTNVSLPSEGQWEEVCLTGSTGDFYFEGADFSAYENMADRTFAAYDYKGKSIHAHFEVTLDVDLIVSKGVDLANRQYDDGECFTAPVGSYQPNKFGLYDMHGNAAEWTLSDYAEGKKTVKGGSYLDRPERCAVEVSYGYPQWQNVYNAGFWVMVLDK